MAKRTTITVETDSLFVLRGQRSLRAWCPQCSVESEMIPLNELSAILNLPESKRGRGLSQKTCTMQRLPMDRR